MPNKKLKGFTLVELLLVIGIIATLAVVAFVALDPAKRFADARDARRVSDVESILSAVHQYVIDNKGSFPPALAVNAEQTIGTGGSGCSNSNGGCSTQADDCVNLSSDLERYLKTIPFDPNEGYEGNTFYTILLDSNGIVTVRACNAEGVDDSGALVEISVSR